MAFNLQIVNGFVISCLAATVITVSSKYCKAKPNQKPGDERKVEQAYLTNDVHRWLDDSVRPDHLMVILFPDGFLFHVL